MKKIIYLLPLIILFIIPFKVNGATYYDRYVLADSGLTDEQKEEYLNRVLADETFINYSKEYTYYLITYHVKNGQPFGSGYTDVIFVMFFNNIPTFVNNLSSANGNDLYYMSHNADKYYFYYADSFNTNNNSLNRLYLLNFKEQIKDSDGNYCSYYNYNIDYVLSSNFSYSLGVDKDIYDLEGNLIKTIKADDNIFEGLKKEVEVNYGIEDIEKSDDTIYQLSKKLLGNLPEEFSFLYSLVSLFIGLVIVLVVLSPIIICLKLLW